ncbi:MAG: sigma-70 family RNA polymerase sigma factor [Candidatus Hydrogenedentes bacterium]|nr:sigma-70 family RNA polymerase sigma factor [Candidatus Hydrogenedentota bacterium]
MDRSDAVLLEQWQRHRDADAFAELVQRHLGMVVASCRRIVGDPSLAEDVAQECFVALMKSRESVRVSLGAWLHKVAVHRSIDCLRSDIRRRKREVSYANDAPAETSSDASHREILSAVDEAIIELPEHVRIVVVGRFLENRTHADLARQLNMSEANVRFRVDKGVNQIRAALRKKGVLTSATVLVTVLSHPAEAAPVELAGSLCKLAASGTITAPLAAGIASSAFVKLAASLLVLTAVGAGYWATVHNDSVPNAVRANVAPSQSTDTSLPKRAENNRSSDAEPRNDAADSKAAMPDASTVVSQPFCITGRITDADTGEAIEGVNVYVYQSMYSDAIGQNILSDANGVYRVAPLPDGQYMLSLGGLERYPDDKDRIRTSVTVQNGKPATGIDFILHKGLPVAGTVLDTSGNPVAEAKVAARSADSNSFNTITAQSESDGKFLLYAPTSMDRVSLQARNATMESTLQESIVLGKDGVNDLVLKLDQPKSASLSGRVIDGNSDPIQGAQLYLLRKDESVFGVEESASTDTKGQFRFANLPPTEFAVVVTPQSANGFSTNEEYLRVKLLPGENRSGIEITYGESGGLSIEGRVVDKNKQPVVGARVSCIAANAETVYSDSQGKFRITGLDDREYQVSIEREGFSQTRETVDAGATGIEIVLRGHGQLQGRVVAEDTGAPIQAFSLGYLLGQSQTLNEMMFSCVQPYQSVDGTFSQDHVSSETITVVALAPGYAPVWQYVDIGEGSPTEIELRLKPSPRVSGIVVNEAGEPIDGAYVYYVSDVSADRMDRAAAARTDAQGRFTVDSLPIDITRLYAYQAGYGVGESALTGQNRIVLPAQSTIDGIVHQDGTILDLVVDLRYPGNRTLPRMRQNVSKSGKFRLVGLSAGPVELCVLPNRGESHRLIKNFELKAGDSLSMEFTYTRGTGSLDGHILNEGEPVANTYVRLVHASADYTEQLSGTTDVNGSFHFDRVWAGESMLMVYRENSDNPYEPNWHEVPFTLQEGQAVSQDIDLSTSKS